MVTFATRKHSATRNHYQIQHICEARAADHPERDGAHHGRHWRHHHHRNDEQTGEIDENGRDKKASPQIIALLGVIDAKCGDEEVINRCWQMGADNPIISIHDVGAGGLSNAFPEITNDAKRGDDEKINVPAVPPASM